MCPEVKLWDNPRQDLLAARWEESPERQNLQWWKDYFLIVADSDFLTGRVKDFVADLEWLLDPDHMARVLNGRYSSSNQGSLFSEAAWATTKAAWEWGQSRRQGNHQKEESFI